MPPATDIKIFLASPADTAAARAELVESVAEINADPLWAAHVKLDLLHWEDKSQPVPCSFLHNPQRDVLRHTGDPARCDLVVALFRHEFGTPLTEAEYGLSPDGDPWTGTEWELHRAVEAAREGQVREVLVFRDTTTFQIPHHLDSTEKRRLGRQYEAVDNFFESCRQAGTREILRGINEYEGPQDLRARFTPMLKAWVHAELLRSQPAAAEALPAPPAPQPADDTLSADQQALHSIVLSHDRVLDDAIVNALWHSRTRDVRSLRGYLLHRYAAWSRPGEGRLDLSFVNLDLLVDRGSQSDGERWETRQRHASLKAMLAAQPDAGAWVLVGDPGGGKSTLLKHHELQAARAGLRALAAGEPLPELCLWWRLADAPHDLPDPQAWLEAEWKQLYPQLPTLAELGQRHRLRHLLDGVNEIQAPDAAAYRAAVRRWAGWAAKVSAQHAPPLFSVRTLEYSESLSTPGLQVEQARLAAWTPEQMEQYCTLRLGADNALWPQIKGDAALRELCALPFNLNAQCELTRALGRPARHRAELFGGLAWLRLRRAFERAELDAPGLLGDDDRRQLADASYWRSHLTELPCEGSLVPGLARQAEAMHHAGRGTRVSQPKQEVAAWFATAAERAAWLKAVQALNLAEVELSGRFRYTHQLWQEFLAAWQIRNLPAQAGAPWPDLAPPALEAMPVTLAGLAAKDPLPGPGVCGWEEAAKLAVLMSEVPAQWVVALQALNLPLAGRAARPCIDAIESTADGGATLSALRQALLQRSRDAGVDLRLRIEAAEALGGLGDPRYEAGRGPTGHRHLLPRPEHWVMVPAGRYRIGTKDGDADEQPVTPVDLEAFQIAFAPVTNAEYRCFIEAGGYETDAWWPEGLARQWRREGLRNERSISDWRTQLKALREDFDAGVRLHFPGATQAHIEGSLMAYADWTEAEAEGILENQFGAKPVRAPAFWQDALFNQAVQPVVGICLFEAQAYCRWLGAQAGRPLRLPTEAEWEAAARRTIRGTGRTWPWGDDDPLPGQFNDDSAHLRQTSPVGVFPDGDSPEGLVDLAGNVWDWTSSTYTPELDAHALNTEAPPDDLSALRAVRGGSWYFRSGDCRAGFRSRNSPGSHYSGLGLRVVCCPHSRSLNPDELNCSCIGVRLPGWAVDRRAKRAGAIFRGSHPPGRSGPAHARAGPNCRRGERAPPSPARWRRIPRS